VTGGLTAGVTLAVIAGLGLGAGLCLLFAGLHPAPRSLAASLQRLDQPTPRPPRQAGLPYAPIGGTGSWGRSSGGSSGWKQLVGQTRRWLGTRTLPVLSREGTGGTVAGALGGLTGDLDADLAVTETPADLHAGTKALSAITGLLTPALLTALLGLAGLRLPLLVPVWVSLTGAVVGYLLPDLRLKRLATEARRVFRASVGAYLDLVAMRMASGSGLAEALHDAAGIGTGPAFAQIRGALADARTDGLTPAQALGQLGTQLHLPDLIDTSTRLRLVDASGAQAQASLRAQAASLRDRELADAQGRANEQSQSMLVAQVVLGFGFVLFLGYPAVVRVLAT
jgi:tight adherence protein C